MKNVMTATKAELARLRKHPELFPSQSVEKDFWRDVYEMSDVATDQVVPKAEAHDHDEDILIDARIRFERDQVLPAAQETQRKPWQKFLHNRAPGVQVDLSAVAEGGSVQILPMPALRILLATVDENRSIVDDIEAVSQFRFA